jgi:hypothetical protein
VTVRVRLPASSRLRVATLAIFANVLGLIVFLVSRSDRLLAAIVDPLHPDWTAMQRAYAAFSIYAVCLLGASIVGVLVAIRLVVRRRGREPKGADVRAYGATAALCLGLTAAVVLVFIEVLIFQDYGIHFYEFDVFGILADAALRRDLGIQPAEVARVIGAAVGLLFAQAVLCIVAARVTEWRSGALPRAAGAAMLVAIPGGFAVFRASERDIGALRSEFTSALPLGRQLLLRADSRPYIAVEPKTGAGGYPVLDSGAAIPAMARKPNIVFYVPDGLRADMVNETLTPSLRAFGRSPDVLTSDRHYSTGHVSEAGIFGLLYGVRAHAFNAFIGNRVPAYPVEILRRNGYHTFFISSSRLNPYPTDQLIRMFDEVVFPANDDEALVALDRYVAARRGDGRPYFMLAFFYTPHFPFTSAKPQHQRYPLVGPKARPNYMNDVIQADDYFRQALQRIGSPDSTVVLFTSDHGEEIRDHGGFGHASATFWNEKVQVPFYLKLPGSVAPRRAPLSSHVDVWPTIFAHLGVEASASQRWSDGRSLLGGDSSEPAVITGRFFPFADRPSAVVQGDRKIWFRSTGVGNGMPCLEVTRITDLEDRVVSADADASARESALTHVRESFWRFLRYTGPQSAPCSPG